MAIRSMLAAALAGWALVVTDPQPHTVKHGFLDKAACEQAASQWQAAYKIHLKQANQNKYKKRRRLAQAIPSTKCVDDASAPPAS